jgi:1-acyl-sn-glycerol-3-phosphate acyltransferase
MTQIKNILARVFAAWAILVFIITLLVAVIPIWLTNFIKEPAGTETFRKISAVWMRVFLTLSGCPLIVKGRKNFKKGETYIVVSNHNSMMDVPVTTPFIPGPNKTIAKIEMANIPLFGLIYKRGSVLVDRKNEESRKASYGKMKELLDQGIHMCIYPEGTRNKTTEPLQRFHDGAFKLAVETGKSILPAVIFNTGKVLPSNKSFYFWPHFLYMHFLEPVEPGNSVSELKEKVFEKMKEYYVKKAVSY